MEGIDRTEKQRRVPRERPAHPAVFSTPPLQPRHQKPGQLTQAQVKHFFTKGYVVVEEFFTDEELQAVKNDLDTQIDHFANWLYKQGKIKNKYEDKGLFQRLTFINEEFPGANILFIKIRKLSDEMKALWSNERVLNMLEQIIGPDIKGHPVWTYRAKLPNNKQSDVPWHQDAAYYDENGYSILTPTIWIPLLDANAENGCLEFLVSSQQTGRVCTHHCFEGDTMYLHLEEDEMEKTLDTNVNENRVVTPVKYGGFVLFNNLTPHRSLPNRSSEIRWSYDFRWQDANAPDNFFGLQSGTLMRSSKDPNLKIDWGNHETVNYHDIYRDKKVEVENAFDETIKGPWTDMWETWPTTQKTKTDL